jgi:hypothetical protein
MVDALFDCLRNLLTRDGTGTDVAPWVLSTAGVLLLVLKAFLAPAGRDVQRATAALDALPAARRG